jgi:hypothetical protein
MSAALAVLSLLVTGQYSIGEVNWQESHPGYVIVGSSTIELPLSQNTVSFVVTEPGMGVTTIDKNGVEVDAEILFRLERSKRLIETQKSCRWRSTLEFLRIPFPIAIVARNTFFRWRQRGRMKTWLVCVLGLSHLGQR